MTYMFCLLTHHCLFFTRRKLINALICQFLSAAGYPWMIKLGNHVCSDIFWKVDASLFLVCFSVQRDALPGITVNWRAIAVIFTWLFSATGFVEFTVISSLWTHMLKRNGNEIVIRITYKLMWNNKEWKKAFLVTLSFLTRWDWHYILCLVHFLLQNWNYS